MTLRTGREPTIEQSACTDCGTDFRRLTSLLLDDEGPEAIAFTSLHHHEVAEAWIDVTFGAFDEDSSEGARVTFGCRVGPVVNSSEPAATAVQAGTWLEDSPMFGHKLSRQEALAHQRLPDFWEAVKFLLRSDPVINQHVYGHPES